jgi:hypothetical protein
MTIRRRLRDHQRLHLERTRDVLFEARVILAQLERDNSLQRSLRRSLADEVNWLERNQGADCLERALRLRDLIRVHYL